MITPHKEATRRVEKPLPEGTIEVVLKGPRADYFLDNAAIGSGLNRLIF